MANRILNADLGIPTPVPGSAVVEAGAQSLIWVMQDTDIASTGTTISLSGGTANVVIEGTVASTGGTTLFMSGLGVTFGNNSVTLEDGASLTARTAGISGGGGGDNLLIAGTITSFGLGISLGVTGNAARGDNAVTLTQTGVINARGIGISDASGQSTFDLAGTVAARTSGVFLGVGSTLSLTDTAHLSAGIGIDANRGASTILNAGRITADTSGIIAGSDTRITNEGRISAISAIDATGTNITLMNHGALIGAVSMDTSGSRVTNLGSMAGGVSMGGLNNTLFNLGTLTADSGTALFMGTAGTQSSNNRLVNKGDILSSGDGVDLAGTFRFTNFGTIDADGVDFRQSQSDADLTSTFHNHGIIGSALGQAEVIFTATASADTFMTNHVGGTINGGIQTLGSTLNLTNRGVINGIVSMSGGSDVYNGRLGFVSAFVAGGDGNDRLTGGVQGDELLGDAGNDSLSGNDGGDRMEGGTGNDALSGGEGNDTLFAGEGDDTALGGAGDDFIVADADSFDDGDDFYDGGTGEDSLGFGNFFGAAVKVNLQQGTSQSAFSGLDVLTGFENATGTGFADSLTGDEGGNELSGAGGADSLQGGDGRDTLLGGGGADKITGGAGRDVMTGGADGDTFIFAALAESGPTVRDIITDFTDFTSGAAGRDRINLTAIDANTTLTGDQAFVSIASGAFVAGASAGKLRFSQVAGNTVLEMEVNNDGLADMVIVLQGLHTITSSDYFL